MWGRLGPRFALEAGFLIAVAVALGLADVRPLYIVIVMAGAWALVSLIELIASREPPLPSHARPVVTAPAEPEQAVSEVPAERAAAAEAAAQQPAAEEAAAQEVAAEEAAAPEMAPEAAAVEDSAAEEPAAEDVAPPEEAPAPEETPAPEEPPAAEEAVPPSDVEAEAAPAEEPPRRRWWFRRRADRTEETEPEDQPAEEALAEDANRATSNADAAPEPETTGATDVENTR